MTTSALDGLLKPVTQGIVTQSLLNALEQDHIKR